MKSEKFWKTNNFKIENKFEILKLVRFVYFYAKFHKQIPRIIW